MGRSAANWGDVVELLLKAVVSGLVVAIASEVSRQSSVLAAVLISLPLTSILSAIWLYRDTHDTAEVASLSWSILWLIIPSLVFFVVLPIALKNGIGFWTALPLACAATGVAYVGWIWGARQAGFDL